MSTLTTLFQEAANNLPQDLRTKAALEFATLLKAEVDAPNASVIDKLADQDELISLLQQEIGRLNRVIVSHADGIENASIAGLDILGERARQRRREGYDDSHDDQLDDWSLASAAMAFIEDARLRSTSGGKGFDDTVPATWPWGKEAWKPKQVRQSLVVAAAMIVAEIDKLDRAVERIKDAEMQEE